MPVITISRGSYSRGKDVAEKVAEKLGVECLSRDVLVEASEEFNVPEIKLLQAIQDAPSILERLTFGKERYIAYVQAALLEHFQRDNVVYHGLAGHFFVLNVAHVLKVRIIAEIEDRVKVVKEREGMTDSEALKVLTSIDESRRKWSRHLYGIDTHDPSLYDLVIHINKLSTDDAADIICFAARSDHFQATPESQQKMDDLALAARVKASLIEPYPRVKAAANNGAVCITIEGVRSGEAESIRDTAAQVPGVKSIEVNLHPFTVPD